MSNENAWNMVAPCGLYCAECTGFLNAKCGGCRSNKGLSKEYRKYCKIYECLARKDLKVCLECEEFPCGFFCFFKAENLEQSSWFLDIWSNMKQIKETNLTSFLKRKQKWLEEREDCAKKRGIKYCDGCKRWPCDLLKRQTLVPVDLVRFKEFMERFEQE